MGSRLTQYLPALALYAAAAVAAFAQAYPLAFSLAASATAAAIGVAIMPTPTAVGLSGGTKVTVTQAIVYERYAYGLLRLGGFVVRKYTHGDKHWYFSRVILLAVHEIESLEYVMMGDERVDLVPATEPPVPSTDWHAANGTKYNPEGKKPVIFFHLHLNDSAGLDTWLMDETADLDDGWKSTDVGKGYAWVRMTVRYDTEIFAGGVPEVSFVIKGKKVYDPRTSTTAWTQNPALCMADYILSDHGFKLPTELMLWDNVSAAANICDVPFTNSVGEVKPTYTIAGFETADEDTSQVLDQMMKCMGGNYCWRGASMAIFAGAPRSSVWTFTEDDLMQPDEGDRAGQSDDILTINPKRSRRDLVNGVKAAYNDQRFAWGPTESKKISFTSYLDQDGGIELVADNQFRFIDRYDLAQRICRQQLELNRQQISVEGLFGQSAIHVQPYDVVLLDFPTFGWGGGKAFQIDRWEYKQGEGILLTLSEYSNSSWDWNNGHAFHGDPAPNFITYDPTSFYDAFSGLTAIEEFVVAPDGKAQHFVKLSWNAFPDPPATIQLQYHAVQQLWIGDTPASQSGSSGETIAISQPFRDHPKLPGTATSVRIGPLSSFMVYDFQLRQSNGMNAPSAWTVVSCTLRQPNKVPMSPKNVRAYGTIGAVYVVWQTPKVEHIKWIEVFASQTSDRGTAVKVGTATGELYRHERLAKGATWYYWVRVVLEDSVYSDFQSLKGAKAIVGTIAASDIDTTLDRYFASEPSATATEPGSQLLFNNDFERGAYKSPDGSLSFPQALGWDVNGSLLGHDGYAGSKCLYIVCPSATGTILWCMYEGQNPPETSYIPVNDDFFLLVQAYARTDSYPTDGTRPSPKGLVKVECYYDKSATTLLGTLGPYQINPGAEAEYKRTDLKLQLTPGTKFARLFLGAQDYNGSVERWIYFDRISAKIATKVADLQGAGRLAQLDRITPSEVDGGTLNVEQSRDRTTNLDFNATTAWGIIEMSYVNILSGALRIDWQATVKMTAPAGSGTPFWVRLLRSGTVIKRFRLPGGPVGQEIDFSGYYKGGLAASTSANPWIFRLEIQGDATGAAGTVTSARLDINLNLS